MKNKFFYFLTFLILLIFCSSCSKKNSDDSKDSTNLIKEKISKIKIEDLSNLLKKKAIISYLKKHQNEIVEKIIQEAEKE